MSLIINPYAYASAAGAGAASTLLLHFNGANGDIATVDSSANAFAVTRQGSAVLSTTQKEFGTTSTSLPGSSGWTVPNSPTINLQGGVGFDFTIDFWFYATVAWPSGETIMAGQWSGSSASWLLTYNPSHGLAFYHGNQFPVFGGGAISINAWHHIAIVGIGAFNKAYLDGVLYGSADSRVTIGTPTDPFFVGYYPTSPALSFVGYIDEFRYVKGTGLYTAPFTPPTSEYTG